jgi:hypothetical protein
MPLTAQPAPIFLEFPIETSTALTLFTLDGCPPVARSQVAN